MCACVYGMGGGWEKIKKEALLFSTPLYEEGPKSNWTLNLVRELEVVVCWTARFCESTQCSSSLQCGINLGWLLLLLWLFF